MFDTLKNFFVSVRADRFKKYRDEVLHRNAVGLETCLVLGLFVAIINMLNQVFFTLRASFVQTIMLVAIFFVLIVAAHVILRKTERFSTLLLYAIQFPVMLFGLFMGTIWDRENFTITFLMLIIALPLFILDKPIRLGLYITAWYVGYIILCHSVKTRELFLADMTHMTTFYVASLLCMLFVITARMNGVESYMLSQKKAEHDELTGLKNRYALQDFLPTVRGRQTAMIMLDVDHFRFYKDMYGTGASEKILIDFAGKLTETFGEDNCYRYDGDEILVVLLNHTEAEFLEKIRSFRESFREAVIGDITVRLSISCGYVFGQFVGREDAINMIRHSDIRLLEAKNAGDGQMVGYPYDRGAEREEVIRQEIGHNLSRISVDALTGLPNMQYFLIKAREMAKYTMDKNRKRAFVYYNISNFKGYNAEYGFQRGDELLQNVAKTLRVVFENALIARFAEDHFVVMDYLDTLDERLQRVDEAIRPMFMKLNMNIQAGIYPCDASETDIESACDKAKLACDSIKKEFEATIAWYADAMEKKNRIRQYVISHIDEAVANGHIRIYYQPIVDVESGKIVELEALSRWQDPEHGLLSPADFIPALEEAGLIYKLDGYVAEAACRDLAELRKKKGEECPVSINLSRLDFMVTDVVETIRDTVKKYNVSPEILHIEVTESAFAEDKEELMKKINELRGDGFEVWLDDFGSGYSSLNNLQDIAFDVIKVDMQFIHSYETNPNAGIIVHSVIDMSRRLGLRTLVEGVETEEQLKFLREIKCNLAQGFLFSKPLPLDELNLAG